MARSGVTFNEVDEAARYLQGLGRNPTVDAIRERLGTGSRTTILEHLKRWKSLQADGEGRLPQPLLSLVTGLWDGLQALAQERITHHQETADQKLSSLKLQLQTAEQTEVQLHQEIQHYQEQLDTEQRAKTALDNQWQTLQKSHDKLDARHQVALKQLDDSRQENQRLHQLALQIQANLEHYQQAIQQQHIEETLAKEKQQALYSQELIQLKTELADAKRRYEDNERTLTAHQTQLLHIQENHGTLTIHYEKLLAKHHNIEHAHIQLQTQASYQKKQTEKNEQDLATERQASHALHQQITILTEQLQRTQHDCRQAEDKITTLSQEKLFLAQEKASLDGALKAWQQKSNFNPHQ